VQAVDAQKAKAKKSAKSAKYFSKGYVELKNFIE
jgi:hypothetical protein